MSHLFSKGLLPLRFDLWSEQQRAGWQLHTSSWIRLLIKHSVVAFTLADALVVLCGLVFIITSCCHLSLLIFNAAASFPLPALIVLATELLRMWVHCNLQVLGAFNHRGSSRTPRFWFQHSGHTTLLLSTLWQNAGKENPFNWDI